MTTTTHCRNCSFFLGERPGNFCPNCGQETAPHVPTAGEFLHEFVGHYVALEGRLAKTLWLLFVKPGALTKEYFAGKRRQYVLPLRLYLTASIVFFLLVKVLGAGSLMSIKETSGKDTKAAVSQARAELAKAGVALPADPTTINLNEGIRKWLSCDSTSPLCEKFTSYMDKKYAGRSTADIGHEVKDRAMAWAPYAMFLFVPVFALLTKLLYRRRRLFYGEHLVYAFHVHAFTFFLLLFHAYLPAVVAPLITFYGAVYYFIAMRRVFGGRWWSTLLRYGVIGAIYPLLLLIAMLVTVVIAAFI